MTVVIDASVLIKWYVPEIHSQEAELLLEPQIDLHAPELALAEFGNILWKKCRLGELSSQESLTIADALLDEDITFHSQSDLLRTSIDLANATGQTVLDLIYLALALSLDCSLITADRKFFLAMRATSLKKQVVWIDNVQSVI